MKRNKYHLKTKEGDEWMRQITDLGCIVCRRILDTYSPGIAHHPLDKDTGRPVQDTGTICLCVEHHDSNGRNGVAFHATGRRTWEALYGTEKELHEYTQQLLLEKQRDIHAR